MKGQIREVKIWDLFMYVVAPAGIAALLWTVLRMVYIQYIPLRPWIFYTVAGVISYFLLKRFVIGLVLLYKVCAPMEVRGRCRFEPTCSTYMIMAILKYGLVYGVFKGIRRVLRCKPPNGGVDYP
jgi:putative membrane protein insertion efficiency factor